MQQKNISKLSENTGPVPSTGAPFECPEFESRPRLNRRRRGNEGEQLAVDFLLKKGYRVVERNYRYERGEIDIIAENSDTLIFVEVKSRRSGAFGDPIDSITPSKCRQIRKAAEGYLGEQEIDDRPCRFDVVTIRLEKGKQIIEHYEDAF